MRTSIYLSLDTRRMRKDGSFPIIFQIVHHRKPASFPSGHGVAKEYWDQKKRKVKSQYKGTMSPARMNNHLDKRLAKMKDELIKLDDRGELDRMTAKEVKAHLINDGANGSFFSFTAGEVEKLIEAGRIGTANNYHDIAKLVRGFCEGRDLLFKDINLAFLLRFEKWHFAKGNKAGGLATYMKVIRAIYNKAIKAKVADRDHYPFDEYSIKEGTPRKRAVDVDTIKEIKTAAVDTTTTLQRDQDIFMLSFYFRGLPYIDMAHLKVGDIIDGQVQVDRQKTGAPLTIKVTDEAWKILRPYLKDKGKQDYIFPIITRTDPVGIYKQVKEARSRYNKNLKKLATAIGLEENLTSYVSRHSFATLADERGVQITHIKDMLGHTKISTTEKYIASLRKNRLAEVQEDVLAGV